MPELISLVERTARLYYMRVRSSARPVYAFYTRARAYVLCTCICVCYACGACVSLSRAYERCTACTHGCGQPSCHPLDVHEMFIDPKGLLREEFLSSSECTTEIDSTICQFKHEHDIDSTTGCLRIAGLFLIIR